jgi:hypothetical protein
MDVFAGSFDNPKEVLGLAHFLGKNNPPSPCVVVFKISP